jgi:hypothetical protein
MSCGFASFLHRSYPWVSSLCVIEERVGYKSVRNNWKYKTNQRKVTWWSFPFRSVRSESEPSKPFENKLNSIPGCECFCCIWLSSFSHYLSLFLYLLTDLPLFNAISSLPISRLIVPGPLAGLKTLQIVIRVTKKGQCHHR